MADPIIISTLTKKYAHLKGEVEAAAKRARVLQKDMYHIECVIRIFREDWEGRKVKAVRPRKPARWTNSRQGMRFAMEILRTAERPLTANEIALRSAELAEMPVPDKESVWAMANAITTGFKRRLGDSVATDGERPARWWISTEKD